MQKAILIVALVAMAVVIIAAAGQAYAVKQPKLTPTERFRSGYAQGWADAALNTGNFCDRNQHTDTYCNGYSDGYNAYDYQHHKN